MGGLARQYEGDNSRLIRAWLDAAADSGMPVDPRAWNTPGAIGSTFPACMAFKAAAEQGPEPAARYLRALREGIMCRRRKLDGAEALVEEARAAGLDAERFRIDLGSHAIVEAFGADLEDTRERGIESLPVLVFSGEDGEERRCEAGEGYDAWRDAAVASGAEPGEGPAPSIEEALARFGSLAAVEVAAVCRGRRPSCGGLRWSGGCGRSGFLRVSCGLRPRRLGVAEGRARVLAGEGGERTFFGGPSDEHSARVTADRRSDRAGWF